MLNTDKVELLQLIRSCTSGYGIKTKPLTIEVLDLILDEAIAKAKKPKKNKDEGLGWF